MAVAYSSSKRGFEMLPNRYMVFGFKGNALPLLAAFVRRSLASRVGRLILNLGCWLCKPAVPCKVCMLAAGGSIRGTRGLHRLLCHSSRPSCATPKSAVACFCGITPPTFHRGAAHRHAYTPGTWRTSAVPLRVWPRPGSNTPLDSDAKRCVWCAFQRRANAELLCKVIPPVLAFSVL